MGVLKYWSLKKELAQEAESAFDTYTYGFSKSSGINYVRKTMFQDHKFDEETLSKIADMMDAENDGSFKKQRFFWQSELTVQLGKSQLQLLRRINRKG